MTILLTKIAGEHTHLVEQVDGTKRRVNVGANEDDGQMVSKTIEEVVANVFFARGDEKHEGTVGLKTMLALDEVGECKETSVTLVTVVRDNAGSKSSFGHVALKLVGNGFSV